MTSREYWSVDLCRADSPSSLEYEIFIAKKNAYDKLLGRCGQDFKYRFVETLDSLKPEGYVEAFTPESK